MSAHDSSKLQERGKINMRVTVVGAVLNFFLVLLKFLVGFFGHSQALIADAVHSLSDLLSDFGLIVALRISRQAPDEDHPYGHERFETIAALAIGLILAANGAWISIHSGQRLYQGAVVTPEAYTLIAAALAILLKEGLYHYTMRAARVTQSAALRANAWDHRSDAISSVLVFLGIGGSLLGFPYLDAIVAIIVGVIVLRFGLTTTWEALQELVDRGLNPDDLAQIRHIIAQVEGVQDLHLLKTRRMGHQILAEAHIQVAPYLSVSEGHQIAERTRRALLKQMPDIGEVTIHIDPENDEEGAPLLPGRREIEQRIHNALDSAGLPLPTTVTLHYHAGRLEVELRYPFPGQIQTDALHQLEIRIQDALRRAGIAQEARCIWFRDSLRGRPSASHQNEA